MHGNKVGWLWLQWLCLPVDMFEVWSRRRPLSANSWKEEAGNVRYEEMDFICLCVVLALAVIIA